MSRKNAEERNRVFAEEAAVVQAQSLLHELMDARGWSRAELARAMNVSRARVTQIFSDECSNLTVRLLARALVALGEEFVLSVRSKDASEGCEGLDMPETLAVCDDSSWVQIENYTSQASYAFANDNIFGGLASLRQLREQDYRLAA
jgi:transcriptional regulator with XRE-family HTH domain